MGGNRRGGTAIRLLIAASAAAQAESGMDRVERCGLFELSLHGPREGNPFVDVALSAQFRQGGRTVKAQGFYDDGGVCRVRFMPDALGDWTYVTRSSHPELDGKTDRFTCVAPSPGNHGPVHVAHTWHFAYADGTPYFQVGTTCYPLSHGRGLLPAGERKQQQLLFILPEVATAYILSYVASALAFSVYGRELAGALRHRRSDTKGVACPEETEHVQGNGSRGGSPSLR